MEMPQRVSLYGACELTVTAYLLYIDHYLSLGSLKPCVTPLAIHS